MVDIELVTFSELLDKLSVVNIKLFNLLEKTAELDKKAEKSKEDVDLIIKLSGENIHLIKQRSNLKSAIDKKLNIAIKNGGTEILDEVKNYNR
jgi:ribosome-associated translation inhibitor RaiA